MEGVEEQVIRKYLFLENLESWFLSQGVSETFAQVFKVVISLATILILALIADFIAKRIFLTTMTSVARRTKTDWDDVLVEKRFFHRLAHFAPAIVVYFTLGIALYDYSPKVTLFLQAITKIYMIFIAINVFNAFLDTVNEIYQELPFARNRPIKGYLQVIKIILYVFAGILVIGIIINKNPASILVGLGASTAILMLVFKDVITGLVASIQLSANEMLKLGDWIEMPSRNLDGTVVDIGLTTVKVQNFDNTITTVPPFALITESFKNWRGMEESAGRRVMKSIIIDSKTVKFCDRELILKLSKINLIAGKVKGIDVDKLHETDPIELMNAGAQTNLNLFRQYVQEYLNHHPEVNKHLTLVVRLKQPVEYGIPMEIYCFLKEKRFVQYEIIQSEILDHIMAALPVFDLKVFQRMSSDDIRAIAKGN